MALLSAVCMVAEQRLEPRGFRSPIHNLPWTDRSYWVESKEESQAIRDVATVVGGLS
jgi:hypothetical protein